jgi:protein-serine/threonine kinase
MINEHSLKLLFAEVLLGLDYLHQNSIIYRDLKADNVVLDQMGHAKVTDFGLAKIGITMTNKTRSFCGSVKYLSPDMLRRNGHNLALDWYNFGIFIYEMLCGQVPFFCTDRKQLFKNIQYADLEFPSFFSPVLRDLLTKLLDRNAEHRLGSCGGGDEIKQHPYFKDLNWAQISQGKVEPLIKPKLRIKNLMQFTMDRYVRGLRKEGNKDLQFEGENYFDNWDYPGNEE